MNNKKIKTIFLTLAISITVGTTINHYCFAQSSTISRPAVSPAIQYTQVGALDVVSAPHKYMNKYIKIKGKFDKFSTLGLDYPPAMRASDKYISFLIQRPDVPNHNIPLSELKIFLKKEIAEKHIDFDAGDEIEFCGRIFSSALGDAWMDVDDFKVLTAKKEPKKEEKTIE
jgi:hypothetical protein